MRIDSFLSNLRLNTSSASGQPHIGSPPNVNSSIFYSEVIEEMKQFIDKLTDLNSEDELDNVDMMVEDILGDVNEQSNKNRMINQYLARLKTHVQMLEQMKANSNLNTANGYARLPSTSNNNSGHSNISSEESPDKRVKRKISHNSDDDSEESHFHSSQYNVRNLKRWFTLIDAFLKRSLETANSVQYFLDQISEARAYTTKLMHLVGGDNVEDGHFMMIKLYLERLQMHTVELDRAKLKHLQINKVQLQIQPQPSATCVKAPESLAPFDGNILHWPLFWSTYQDLISSMGDDTKAKFRLLLHNIDTESRIRMMSDINPDSPELDLVFRRLKSHFEDPTKVLQHIKLQFTKLKSLKHRYSKQSWLALLESAQLSKVTLDKHNFGVAEEEVVVKTLLEKLPLKYRKLYQDNFWIRFQRNSVEDFVSLCELHISIIDQRVSLGLATVQIEVPNELCLFCEADYHYPVQCDMPLRQRFEVIQQLGKCRRCLVDPFERGHNCGGRCDHCNQPTHHVALCANHRVDPDSV